MLLSKYKVQREAIEMIQKTWDSARRQCVSCYPTSAAIDCHTVCPVSQAPGEGLSSRGRNHVAR